LGFCLREAALEVHLILNGRSWVRLKTIPVEISPLGSKQVSKAARKKVQAAVLKHAKVNTTSTNPQILFISPKF
jgi:hypothetical protein